MADVLPLSFPFQQLLYLLLLAILLVIIEMETGSRIETWTTSAIDPLKMDATSALFVQG